MLTHMLSIVPFLWLSGSALCVIPLVHSPVAGHLDSYRLEANKENSHGKS